MRISRNISAIENSSIWILVELPESNSKFRQSRKKLAHAMLHESGPSFPFRSISMDLEGSICNNGNHISNSASRSVRNCQGCGYEVQPITTSRMHPTHLHNFETDRDWIPPRQVRDRNASLESHADEDPARSRLLC